MTDAAGCPRVDDDILPVADKLIELVEAGVDPDDEDKCKKIQAEVAKLQKNPKAKRSNAAGTYKHPDGDHLRKGAFDLLKNAGELA